MEKRFNVLGVTKRFKVLGGCARNVLGVKSAPTCSAGFACNVRGVFAFKVLGGFASNVLGGWHGVCLWRAAWLFGTFEISCVGSFPVS